MKLVLALFVIGALVPAYFLHSYANRTFETLTISDAAIIIFLGACVYHSSSRILDVIKDMREGL